MFQNPHSFALTIIPLSWRLFFLIFLAGVDSIQPKRPCTSACAEGAGTRRTFLAYHLMAHTRYLLAVGPSSGTHVLPKAFRLRELDLRAAAEVTDCLLAEGTRLLQARTTKVTASQVICNRGYGRRARAALLLIAYECLR